MGTLHYGSPRFEIDFDDRALLHLQIVITAKLRRDESFVFSWTDSAANGSGRSSLWMEASIPLLYRYRHARMSAVNPAWVSTLLESANSGSGLLFSTEPEIDPRPTNPL